MTPRRLLVALLLLIVAAPLVAAPPRDWSKMATRTPTGAFVEGNPAARVKLVEYLSLTCPHCAKFESEAIAPLTAKYIKTGLVSYEVRHALRDAFDLAASLLARCDGPARFFALAPIVYAQQPAWMEQATKWSTATPPAEGTPPATLLPMVAAGAGLDTLVAAHGVPAARAKACLADAADRTILTRMADEAWHRPGFPGTPTFLIDGVAVDGVATWDDLDRRLAAALRK